ncbi:electron transfer flavoprotein subunit beta/FixA family protein [Cupriavidus lacunae]|uniref:Electron transfer flavoprotein subunit beta n=1 Tax=Cupriavidus lacunae TaxID=2666307 RepID=A0A370NMS1_9BURK|nr:electron transfer flavoprotein subunit beta/FixA family protein [Cupriavidus lacunae]RDK06892.1 electron transfer flavoprotein subunit beta/FixA family protein [Cupriavidus lacunae]
MKILVTVKRVVDANVKVRVKADGSGVDLANLKMSINPFDEIAVEEAVRLKERGAATEVVAVSIGPPGVEDVLRSALAIGADRGVLLQHDGEIEPLAVAKALRQITLEEAPGLVILGKQTIDYDCDQTGQMLAGLLGWPQATFASEIAIEGDRAVVKREVDAGHQTVNMCLPGIVTADLRLNQPRHVSLPSIMKAKKKPIAMRELASLGVDVAPRLAVLKMADPPHREAGVKVASVQELVQKLKQSGALA